MPNRRNLQVHHPFTRLNKLLAGIEPGLSPGPEGQPILLSLGEPQSAPPDFLAEELTKAAAGWSRYPPPRGSADYLQACADWLTRRYGLPADLLDPARHIVPLPGTREGLFFATLAATPDPRGGAPAVVLMPNPFYHVYAGSAIAAAVEPVFVDAPKENGFQPDYAALDPALLDRAAFCLLCSPANPQGSVAPLALLEDVILLARKHDFVVAFDECYAEIHNGEPPPGALQAAANLGGSLDNILVFHSLSKRSSAPGPALRLCRRRPRHDRRPGGRHCRRRRRCFRARPGGRRRAVAGRSPCGGQPGALSGEFRRGRADSRQPLRLPQTGRRLFPVARCRRRRGRPRSSSGARPESRCCPAAICAPMAPMGGTPGAAYIRVALVYDPALTEAALGRITEIL